MSSEPNDRVIDLLAALEASVAAAKAARVRHPTLTPRQRWGTCCPHDPECDHSYLDNDELTRWMDTKISDADAAEMAR